MPAIAQDAETGDILMMAWMNRESLRLTAEEGQAIYWSRSRGKLWRKGKPQDTSRSFGTFDWTATRTSSC